MTAEEWRPIVGFPGYEVSDLGGVRHGGHVPIRDTSGNGYPRVWLIGSNGRGVRRPVHQVVTEAFHGPRPAGQEVRHRNGDRRDNRAANLSWSSHRHNMADLLRHGTHYQANKDACPRSHPYDADNTYVSPDGARHCRTCRRDRARASRAS